VAKVRMRDIVVLLPGITGSVLQKDGKDIWAISGQAVWKALTSLGSSLQQLMLRDDNPEIDVGEERSPILEDEAVLGLPVVVRQRI
jgi:hypothetical protein